MQMTPTPDGEPTEAPPPVGGNPRPAQTIERVELFRDLASIENAWRELETRCFTSVHLGFDWCRQWVESTGADPLVAMARFSEGGRILLPLEVTRIAGAKVGRFIGSSFSNLNFGLFSPDEMRFAPDELAAALHRAGMGLDLLALYRQPKTWRGLDNPLMALARARNHNQAFQMTLVGGFDAALARINGKKRRKKYRLGQRKMEEMGGYRLVHGDDPDTANTLLEAFFLQKAARFDKQGKLDVFARPSVREFFRRLVVTPGEKRRPLLRLSAIELADGRYGALAGVTRKNGHLICQFGSIDEQMAGEYSIGEFLFYHLIEEACADGEQLFDFGIGDEAYKRSWCDQITTHYDCYLPLTAKGRAVGLALRGATAAKQRIKAQPKLDRIARAVQRRLLGA